jgi:hypothetical protein
LLIVIAVLLVPLFLLMRDPPHSAAAGPQLLLPVASLFALGLCTALVVLNQVYGAANPKPFLGPITASEIALAAMLALAFIPNIVNASGFLARKPSSRFRLPDPESRAFVELEQRRSEGASALLATGAIAAIVSLALAAGKGDAQLNIQSQLGLLVGVGLIAAFVVIIFIDALSGANSVRGAARWFTSISAFAVPLSGLYRSIDFALVRVGAFVAGVRHRTARARYGLFAGQLACLCLLAWFLPAPMGLVASAIATILVFSVIRLWNWVEIDRAHAGGVSGRRAPLRIGLREDYRDEAILGLVFILILMPITLKQAHDSHWLGVSFANGDGRSFIDWFAYIGAELAKAVPFVDWAEIYGVRASDGAIAPASGASRHALFAARALMDLVLLAAIVQTLASVERNRQRKTLYREGYINYLDPFVERVELVRAMKACQGANPSEFNIGNLGHPDVVDFRRYDQTRLRQLYVSMLRSDVRAFIDAMVADDHGIVLMSPAEFCVEIAEIDSDEDFDLVSAWDLARRQHDHGVSRLDPEDVFRLMTALRNTPGLRTFKARLAQDMLEIGDPSVVADLLMGLTFGAHADAFRYAREDYLQRLIAAALAAPSPAPHAELLKILSDDPKLRPVVVRRAIAALRARQD